MSAAKTRAWAAHYTRSDIAHVEAINAELAKRGKQKSWLASICAVPRQTMYVVLAGTYRRRPADVIAKLEAALGIAAPAEAEPEPEIMLATSAEDIEPELDCQILDALARHSKRNPLARKTLIESIDGKRRDVVDALDALIAARRVCDVTITRRGERPIVYCYPAGKVDNAFSFRVAKPKARGAEQRP